MTDQILERRRLALVDVQRDQILAGFAVVARDKGFASTTIADICRAAHVSKTTFYEQFADKEAVYLALHEHVATAVFGALQAAVVDAGPDWRARLRAGVRAYLTVLASDPMHLAQIAIEPTVATPAARDARDAAGLRFAAFVDALGASLVAAGGDVDVPPTPVLRAAFGGVLALVQQHTEDPEAVLALEDHATELLVRVVRAPQPAVGSRA